MTLPRRIAHLTVITFVFGTTYMAACRPPGPSQPTPEPEAPGPICTREAKVCPDGTEVGRTGPDCAFPPCPNEGAGGPSPDPAPPSGPSGDPEPVPMKP